MQLHWIDLTIIIVYIIGITCLGAWIGARQKDIKGYFVGDRNVHWFLVLISIVATETSTVTFLSVPGLAFDINGGNFTFLQLAMGYLVGRAIIAWLLLPAYFRGECFTAYEVLKNRFDVRVQRSASALFLATRTVADGLRLFLTALLLSQVMNWDMTASILILGFFTLIYTYIGGMQAVIWTDLIQFFIYLSGAILAACYIISDAPGGWDGIMKVGGEAGKFKVFDFGFTGTNPLEFWVAFIGGAFISMASHGADQSMVQRYLCARNLKEARFSLVASAFVVIAQFTLFLGIGAGLYVLWNSGSFAFKDPTVNDGIFGQYIIRRLPTGIVGIVVAAVLAVAMSSMSSSLNSASNAFVNDFYKPMRPGRGDKHYLLVAKLATLFWGVLKIISALCATAIFADASVVKSVLSVAGLATGIVLGLFALGQLPKPVQSSAALCGLVLGGTLVTWVWAMGNWKVFTIPWPLYAPIGTLSTIGIALLANNFFNDGEKKQLAGPR